jgi:hypothetical protein
LQCRALRIPTIYQSFRCLLLLRPVLHTCNILALGRSTAHAIQLRALLALRCCVRIAPTSRSPRCIAGDSSNVRFFFYKSKYSSHVFKSRLARFHQLSISITIWSSCFQKWFGRSCQASRLATSKRHVISDSFPQQHTSKAIIFTIFPSLYRRWYIPLRLFTQFESTTMRSYNSIS